MANLKNFRVDSQMVEAGCWISPGDEYDNLELLVRGYTDAYTDARASKLRRAALSFGGNADKIPAARTREIMVECLIKYIVMDVRNLSDENGTPILFPQFCDLLRNPDYADLVLAVLKAAALVGTQKSIDLESTKKN